IGNDSNCTFGCGSITLESDVNPLRPLRGLTAVGCTLTLARTVSFGANSSLEAYRYSCMQESQVFLFFSLSTTLAERSMLTGFLYLPALIAISAPRCCA